MAPESPSPSAALPPVRRACLLAAVAVLAFAACASASAQFLYVCNSKGHTYSGGMPPPECKDQDLRELNPDGTLHKLIPAPLTPEQRRARDAAERERIRQEESERAQAHLDRSLLETYGSVSEIEAARSRAIAARQVLVERADQRIAQYAKERKRLDDEAEFYQKREMPAKLKDAYAANKALTEQQEKTKADVLVEIRNLNQRYDAQVKRYKELEEMAAQAAALRERESNGGVAPPQENN